MVQERVNHAQKRKAIQSIILVPLAVAYQFPSWNIHAILEIIMKAIIELAKRA